MKQIFGQFSCTDSIGIDPRSTSVSVQYRICPPPSPTRQRANVPMCIVEQYPFRAIIHASSIPPQTDSNPATMEPWKVAPYTEQTHPVKRHNRFLDETQTQSWPRSLAAVREYRPSEDFTAVESPDRRPARCPVHFHSLPISWPRMRCCPFER